MNRFSTLFGAHGTKRRRVVVFLVTFVLYVFLSLRGHSLLGAIVLAAVWSAIMYFVMPRVEEDLRYLRNTRKRN